MGMEMKPSDLGELYILLRMYMQCYGPGVGRTELLLSDVKNRYRSAYETMYHKKAPAEVSNPRGAGRKPVNDPNLSAKVRTLYAEGKTMREIARVVNCSVGHVHKLIREQ